jgi:endonuclease/exonuclease/phosphatase family metal-dependent hydrolase
MQDVLLHGQNLRSVKRSIADLNPNYQILSDIARHDTDDIRSKNYAGWGSSGMACLTMLHKDIFNISLCRKHEWRSGKDRRTTLGRGRVLWIKAVTVTGQKVDIVNVYQHTSKYPQKQQRLQAALTKALSSVKDPCMFFGDFNASISGGRINYAPAHANNPTTIADQAFAEFIEATKGKVIPPARSTWKSPFGGLKGQEAKLDFGIV